MDEVEGHRGRGPDEIVEPVNEAGERSDTDDTERGLGTGGHRADASPGETEGQAGRERSMRNQGTRRVLTLALPSRGKMHSMKVIVLGTGAVGAYYGGQLARAGHEVTCPAGIRLSEARDPERRGFPVRGNRGHRRADPRYGGSSPRPSSDRVGLAS